MDNPEKNEKGNQQWTIQRKMKGQSTMDNLDKSEKGNQQWTIQRKTKKAINNGQSTDTGKIGNTRHKMKTNKTKNATQKLKR